MNKKTKDNLDKNSQEIVKRFTQHNIERHLSLYVGTRNGLLLWKAFQESFEVHQKFSIPMDERILEKFSLMAKNILNADSPDEILRALELKNEKGGPGVHKDLIAKERQRNQMEDWVNYKIAHPEKNSIEIDNIIAESHSVSAGSVKTLRTQKERFRWRDAINRILKKYN